MPAPRLKYTVYSGLVLLKQSQQHPCNAYHHNSITSISPPAIMKTSLQWYGINRKYREVSRTIPIKEVLSGLSKCQLLSDCAFLFNIWHRTDTSIPTAPILNNNPTSTLFPPVCCITVTKSPEIPDKTPKLRYSFFLYWYLLQGCQFLFLTAANTTVLYFSACLYPNIPDILQAVQISFKSFCVSSLFFKYFFCIFLKNTGKNALPDISVPSLPSLSKLHKGGLHFAGNTQHGFRQGFPSISNFSH